MDDGALNTLEASDGVKTNNSGIVEQIHQTPVVGDSKEEELESKEKDGVRPKVRSVVEENSESEDDLVLRVKLLEQRKANLQKRKKEADLKRRIEELEKECEELQTEKTVQHVQDKKAVKKGITINDLRKSKDLVRKVDNKMLKLGLIDNVKGSEKVTVGSDCRFCRRNC